MSWGLAFNLVATFGWLMFAFQAAIQWRAKSPLTGIQTVMACTAAISVAIHLGMAL